MAVLLKRVTLVVAVLLTRVASLIREIVAVLFKRDSVF